MHDKSEVEPVRDRLIFEALPDEYRNVRFWVFLILAHNGLFLLLVAGTLWDVYLEGGNIFDSLSTGQFVLAVWSGAEFVVWVIALYLWSRVRMAGFWTIAVLTHVGLLAYVIAALFGGIVDESLPLRSGCIAVFILLCFLTNIWSRSLLRFFRRVNGRGPSCQVARLSKVKANLNWLCPHCNCTVLWRKLKSLRVSCPKCRTRLRGVTTEMVGDTGVCTKCKYEFKIAEHLKHT